MDLYNETEYYLKFIQENLNKNVLNLKTDLNKATDYKKIVCMLVNALRYLGLKTLSGREKARTKADKIFTIYTNT